MKLNSIDLNKLRAFSAVVKSGSYRAAADELGLTPSAISQSMTTLEAQIGAPLFLRKGRRIFPTEEAKSLAKSFDLNLRALNQQVERVIGKKNEVQGLVRIGAYYEFAKSILLPLIKTFSFNYPNARIKLTFDSPSRLQRFLETGRVDLNFSIFPHKGANEIESKKVFKQELVLIAPKDEMPIDMTLRDILSLPLVEYFPSHCLFPKWVEKNFGHKMQKVVPKLYASSAEMVLELVKSGLGIGVVPRYILTPEREAHLSVFRPNNQPWEDFVWLNQFRGQFDNSAHREFYKFICTELAPVSNDAMPKKPNV